MRCIKCGTELAPNSKFCSQCGAARPILPPRFQASEREFAALQAQRNTGKLTAGEFDEALKKLVVQDDAGTFWMLGAESGEWHRYNGTTWVRAEPPMEGHTPATLPEVSAAPSTRIAARQRAWRGPRSIALLERIPNSYVGKRPFGFPKTRKVCPPIRLESALVGVLFLFACVACLLVEALVAITTNPQEVESEALTSVARAATQMPAGLGTRTIETQAAPVAQDVLAPTSSADWPLSIPTRVVLPTEQLSPTQSATIETKSAPSPTQTIVSPTATATPTHTFVPPSPTRLPTTRTPTRTPTRIPPTPTRPLALGQSCPNPPHSVYWSDDFSNRSSGWTEYYGADYNHFYKDGEFHFAVTQKNKTGNAWMLLRERSLHQAIVTRAWKLEGPALNNYGVVFGGQDDNNYYTFRISDSGSYRIAKLVQGQWHDLIPWTKTAAIRQNGVNELALLMDGAQIYACVNGQLVGATSDAALQPGRVGLVAGAYDEPVHIHFDDFAVWNLQGAVTLNQAAWAPPTVSSNLPSGVYITALCPEPANPKRNQGVSFVATFLNTTGTQQPFDWLVLVYQPDAKKAFGETDAQRIVAPPGVSQFTSASNWSVRGPGGCIALYGVPHFQNPDASRVPFKQSNGNNARIDFSVCP
ncbi:MAG: zinc-ribbon domain-containing protein [Chloroflexi bacterium]|nr:zinc-ribbon domain-containing protein [Chloroflexota bacterium]